MSKQIGVIITTKDDCGFDGQKLSAKFNAIAPILDKHQVVNRELIGDCGIMGAKMPEDNLASLQKDLDQDFDVRAEGLVRAI